MSEHDDERTASDNSLKERDFALREREISLKEKEAEAKIKLDKKSLWFNSPLLIGGITAIVGLIGTGIGALLQGNANFKLERQKFEFTLIQKALQTSNQDEIAKQLLFLVNTGVIESLDGKKIQEIAKTPSQLPSHYKDSLTDAFSVSPSKLSNDLVAITPNNKQLMWNADKSKVLVLTWKSEDSYEKFLKPYQTTSPNPTFTMWVTVAPQVQKFCQNYQENNPKVSNEELELRLKQYLGLNPHWEYDVFVELWISPADLFRPCVDPEIEDSTCKVTIQTPTS